MIAAWLFELLRRERDWRAALPTITTQLRELPEERVRAAFDLGAAFEHLEPDRRYAISAYQLAGRGRDRGRSRALALELGWWPAVARLAHVELEETGAIEPLVMACRTLMDAGKSNSARRLLDETPIDPACAADRRLEGVRAEIEARYDEWSGWAWHAKKLSGAAAGDAHLTAARLARGANQPDWTKQLEAALAADPHNHLAAAMLIDVALASTDRKAVLDMLKIRLVGLETLDYCDALRAIATRLWSDESGHHAGLARRMLQSAIDRAYTAKLTAIPGHLAMWTIVDAAATEDGRRTELLPLVLRGLEAPVPVFDHVWLAALGAAICADAGDRNAANAYAAVVAEHAPSHPIVREVLAESPAANDSEVERELVELELDARTVVQVQAVAPDDDLAHDFDLAPMGAENAASLRNELPSGRVPDPRFIDLSVPVLEDAPEPPPPAKPVLPKVDEPVKNVEPAKKLAPVKVEPIRAEPKKPELAKQPRAKTASVGWDEIVEEAPKVEPKPVVAPPATQLDDDWNVDDQLFLKAAAAAPAPAAVSVASTLASTSTRASTSGAKPLGGIIPSAAMRVLQSAGAPKPLPKIPPPPTAIPRANRTLLAVDVRLQFDGRTFDVHTRDLSTSGFFAVTAAQLPNGTVVDCEIRIPSPDKVSEQSFATRAKVMRKEVAGYGFAFVDPSPALVAAIDAVDLSKG